MDKFNPIVGVNKDDILQKISQEVSMATQYVSSKRVTFRDRLKLYNNQRKQRDKVAILTIYTTVNTLLAVNYTDDITVEFTGREFGDNILSDNINSVATFDHEEMGLDQINYLVQWDRLFYGVGIRDISTFNIVTNTPIVKSMSPLSWLPDPNGGMSSDGNSFNFRFYGFEVSRTEAEMTEERGFFNLENISACATPSPEQQDTKSMENEAHDLNDVPETNYKGQDYYQIDWYTELKNENGGTSKYLVTVDPACTEIYRIEKILPVTAEEKADESLVPFPLVLNYYSPQRNDPFGTSVCDLVEDKQRAKSVLANLRISKEKADLYPMYIYNTQSIRNRRDLDFGFNKAIAVNLQKGQPLSEALMPIQKDKNSNSTFAQEQSLTFEASLATGSDQMQSGVISTETRTASEIQQVTLNAQTRFLLGYKINAWGEKRLWKLWYRMYRQYFSKSQKKIIRLQGGFGARFNTITRKDFVTVQDPDVSIVSKIELMNRRDRERLAFTQVYPLIAQDPTKPLASKNFALRHLLKLNGLATDTVDVLAPESPDEMRARTENELLSRNMTATIEITDDHLSHLVIHSAAEDTDAKFAHMEAHKQAYILSGQKALVEQLTLKSLGAQQGQANQALNSVSQQDNNLLMNPQTQPLATV